MTKWVRMAVLMAHTHKKAELIGVNAHFFCSPQTTPKKEHLSAFPSSLLSMKAVAAQMDLQPTL